ncbi:hypothetical protein PybrP1_005561 [[Pythium] brassicae (nom. inval.)]|nr:hypothetical protein PybrP1_005561 [[Pythium] brassicae (nom. inval.)]
MAEALYYLSEDLAWAPASAPRGEFVVVTDAVESSGAFLMHHLLALFLKAGHRVCFVHFASSREHYAAVARKLGVNFSTSEAAGALHLINCFASPPSTLLELFDAIAAVAEADSSKEPTPVSVVIDDLSALKWEFGADKVLAFARCCKTLTHASNGCANVVMLSHADTEASGATAASSQLSQSTSSKSPLKSMNPVLRDIASVIFSVAPLPSGYSKDVHGTLMAQRQNSGLEPFRAPVTLSYKILENTIKCFRSGGDALRSM